MAGFLTMATVIVAQAVFLQDGGLLALGANLFNIGAVTVFSGYALFHLMGAPQQGRRLPVAGFIAGWTSVVLSAVCCGLELGLSGAVPLQVGLMAMTGYHAVVGLVEGALTAGCLTFLARVRPDLLAPESGTRFGWAEGVGGLVLITIPAAILVLAGGSSLPDPLQALLAGPRAVGIQGSAPSSAGSELNRMLLYPALFAVCVIAYLAGRWVRLRKGRP